LHNLESALGEWNLIQDLKSIETASIPVIKAKIDLKKVRKLMRSQEENKDTEEDPDSDTEHFLPIDITFDDSQGDATANSQGPNPGFFNNFMMGGQDNFNLNLLGNVLGGNQGMGFGAMASGAPTAVSKTHLGIASCNLLKEYVTTYPCLREVGILLKEFLAIHDLNSAYRGGISSYSAILLIVAYMNNFKLHQSPHITPSRLLMGFLEFYTKFFDPRTFGVNTLN